MTLLITFFTGRKLFNRWVGFASAVALTSAPWFLFRARSGNLDIFLTFFFVLTIYLAFKALEKGRYFIPLGISLGILFLTKTGIPFIIIPSLVAVFFGKKIDKKWLYKGIFGFITLFGAWFITQAVVDINFISRYIRIGIPGIQNKSSYLDNVKLIKDYIHVGIGKWFWLGTGAIIGSFITRKKSFIVLAVFCLSFIIPFTLSNKGQIWHLIPLFPFMILLFFGFTDWITRIFIKNKLLVPVMILGISLYFSYFQIKSNWYQFINIQSYISDEEILSTEASKYQGALYIDNDFVPAAIFYSGKNVQQTYVGGVTKIFNEENGFLLITTKGRLKDEGIRADQYKVIKEDRDKILIKEV